MSKWQLLWCSCLCLSAVAACGTTTNTGGTTVIVADVASDAVLGEDTAADVGGGITPTDVAATDAGPGDDTGADAGEADASAGDASVDDATSGSDTAKPGDTANPGDTATAGDAANTGDTATTGDTTLDTGPTCSPSLCDDKDPCTDDGCDATGKCAHGPKPGCGDNPAPCNLPTDCTSAICDTAKHLCVDCQVNADCGGKGLCLAQTCVPAPACASDGQCKATNQVCDKIAGFCVDCTSAGDCKVPETCVASKCVPAAPKCASSKNCSGLLVCDKAAGVCVGCVSGADCGPDLACVASACVAKTCTTPICVGNDVWSCNADGSGFVAKPTTCDDAQLCTDDLCVPGKGCDHAANSQACSDSDACTTGDVCSGGKCASGTATGCDDQNACTDDSCKPESGCVHLPGSSTTCNDGNFCTTSDACQKGVCAGVVTVNCDDANTCTLDACDVQGCTHVAASNPCEDGNPCTVSDLCAAKVCTAGTANTCDDGNECTDDSCDPKAGCVHTTKVGCVPKFLPPCTVDGDCTGGTVCNPDNHTCVACVQADDCPAGNICQANACKAALVCASDIQCKATKQVCGSVSKVCVDCNSVTDCAANEACEANLCVPAIPCQSSKTCAKTCDAIKGVCVDCKSDADCEASQFCGDDQNCHTDLCTASVCNGGTLWACLANGSGYSAAVSCDDGVVCTADACTAGACVHSAKPDALGIDFPANGLDDNCDGTTDETKACDVGGFDGQKPGNYALALDVCTPATSDFPVLAGTSARSIATLFGNELKPTAGKSLVLLSTGTVGSSQPGQGTEYGTNVTNPFSTGTCSATTAARDLTELRLTLTVPSNATTLSFDWTVFSAEYPQWIGNSQYGDAFMAIVEGKAWAGNAAVDGNGKCGTVSTVSFNNCANCSKGTGALAGTGFESNGASGWWSTSFPVQPGDTVKIHFYVYDGGDGKLDTVALLDNVRWGGGKLTGVASVGK